MTDLNEEIIKAFKDYGKEYYDVYIDKGFGDFSAGFRAGVAWAEEFGDCSFVKWWGDCLKELEEEK